MNLETIAAQVIPTLAGAAGGAVLSLAGAYLLVAKELSYIKGQMENVARAVQAMDNLKGEQFLLRTRVDKCETDINNVGRIVRQARTSGHG
jgi:hypothetical protein